MSTYTDIRKALEDKLLTVAGITTSNVAWENFPFNPDAKALWVRPSLQVVSQRAAVLGPTPVRRDDGMLLVDVFGTQNLGAGAVEVLVDAILTAFYPSTLLTGGGKTIRILSSQRALGRNEQPWYSIPITISFYTYINE